MGIILVFLTGKLNLLALLKRNSNFPIKINKFARSNAGYMIISFPPLFFVLLLIVNDLRREHEFTWGLLQH